MFSSLIFAAERHSDSCNIIWMSSIFSQKNMHSNDIAKPDVFLESNTFSMCDFMFMQHNNYSDKVSLSIERLVLVSP